MFVLRKNSTELTPYPIYDFFEIERLRDCAIERLKTAAHPANVGFQSLNDPTTQSLNS